MTELPPYHYFRDHDDSGAWGVRDARDGKVLAVGLDKGQAHAIAELLNGRIQQACGFLLDVRDCYPSEQYSIGQAPRPYKSERGDR